MSAKVVAGTLAACITVAIAVGEIVPKLKIFPSIAKFFGKATTKTIDIVIPTGNRGRTTFDDAARGLGNRGRTTLDDTVRGLGSDVNASLEAKKIEPVEQVIHRISPSAKFVPMPNGTKLIKLEPGKEYKVLEAIIENQPARIKPASEGVSIRVSRKLARCRIEYCPSLAGTPKITGECLNFSASKQGTGPVDFAFEAGPMSVSVTFEPEEPTITLETGLNDCMSLKYETSPAKDSSFELGSASCTCSAVFYQLAAFFEKEIPTEPATMLPDQPQ
jgi:hypothetical protein